MERMRRRRQNIVAAQGAQATSMARTCTPRRSSRRIRTGWRCATACTTATTMTGLRRCRDHLQLRALLLERIDHRPGDLVERRGSAVASLRLEVRDADLRQRRRGVPGERNVLDRLVESVRTLNRGENERAVFGAS